MDIEILTQAGLSEVQAKIYLYLVKYGQSTPTEVAKGISENRTTVYSALERLVKLGIVTQKDRGKISAYTPNHPSVLESIVEKRLRSVARQSRNLESNLPSLINYYNEHQYQPGVTTFYGQEGIELIRKKVLNTKQTVYFIRSPYDEKADKDSLEKFKKARVAAGISSENITPSEYTNYSDEEARKWGLTRTFLPPDEYHSPVQIEIFGDNVAFMNYNREGMSTLIESPEIAEAMRQFFLFAKKYIRKATNQDDLKPSGDK